MRLKRLLDKAGIKPDLVKLDQCFMIDPEVIRCIIKHADLKKSDIVTEIGSGTGILTSKIAKYVSKIYAIELDFKLFDILSSMLSKDRNAEIVMGDVKKYGFFDANKIISNVPYSITDWLFEKLNNHDFELAVLTIPLKFYEKHADKYNNLIIEKVKIVNPQSFYPQPRIQSCIVKIKKKN